MRAAELRLQLDFEGAARAARQIEVVLPEFKSLVALTANLEKAESPPFHALVEMMAQTEKLLERECYADAIWRVAFLGYDFWVKRDNKLSRFELDNVICNERLAKDVKDRAKKCIKRLWHQSRGEVIHRDGRMNRERFYEPLPRDLRDRQKLSEFLWSLLLDGAGAVGEKLPDHMDYDQLNSKILSVLSQRLSIRGGDFAAYRGVALSSLGLVLRSSGSANESEHKLAADLKPAVRPRTVWDGNFGLREMPLTLIKVVRSSRCRDVPAGF